MLICDLGTHAPTTERAVRTLSRELQWHRRPQCWFSLLCMQEQEDTAPKKQTQEQGSAGNLGGGACSLRSSFPSSPLFLSLQAAQDPVLPCGVPSIPVLEGGPGSRTEVGTQRREGRSRDCTGQHRPTPAPLRCITDPGQDPAAGAPGEAGPAGGGAGPVTGRADQQPKHRWRPRARKEGLEEAAGVRSRAGNSKEQEETFTQKTRLFSKCCSLL